MLNPRQAIFPPCSWNCACIIASMKSRRSPFLFPQRERWRAAVWAVLTQIWWFVRRSCIRQQSIELLPLQTVVQGLLLAEGGEGPFCPGLGFWCFKHLSVWNGVHARYVQIAAVIRSLASIGRDKGRHPAPIRVAQGFTFLCAVGEEIHACKHERKRNYRYKLQHRGRLLADKKDYAKESGKRNAVRTSSTSFTSSTQHQKKSSCPVFRSQRYPVPSITKTRMSHTHTKTPQEEEYWWFCLTNSLADLEPTI